MQAFFSRMKMTWTFFFLSNYRWEVLLDGCLLKFPECSLLLQYLKKNLKKQPSQRCSVILTKFSSNSDYDLSRMDTFDIRIWPPFSLSCILYCSIFLWEPGIPTWVLSETNFGTSNLLNIRTHSRDASKALLCWRNSKKEIWEPCGLLSFYNPFHNDLLRQWSLTLSLSPPSSLPCSSVGASRLYGSSSTLTLQAMPLPWSSP